MRRLLLSFSLFSLLAISQPTYCDELLSSEEPVDILSLEEDASEEADLLSLSEELDLEDELISLEEEIENIEKDALTIDADLSVPIALSEVSLESIENIAPSLDQITSSLFSTLEENAPLQLVSESTQEEPSFKLAKSEIAEPFLASQESPPLESTITKGIEINLIQVISGSPLIYALLLGMSLSAIAIWFYSMSSLKNQSDVPESFAKEIRSKLLGNDFQEVSHLCENNKNLFPRIIAAGLNCRKHGLQTMIENMKAEGKRATISAWQRLSLLQDIVIIAPMLGLLGTVLGMFYAFYDLNRSLESVTNLFDGFGISVGTTVAGIGVAILSMILHSTAKFRLVRALARVENEATSLARLMDEKN